MSTDVKGYQNVPPPSTGDETPPRFRATVHFGADGTSLAGLSATMTNLERLPLERWSSRARWPFRPVHSLFFSRAAASPGTPAVICGDHFQSYGEIACRACALSAELRAAGATRDKAVSVVMQSGWERVVAVLGILAAGAGYFPIDPSLPHAMQQRLMREEKSELIVTQPWLEPGLAGDEPRPILTIGGDAAWSGGRWTPPFRQGPSDLARASRALGPDGRDARTHVDHAAAATEVVGVNQANEVDESDSLLELSALEPAASLFDPLGPLAVGGAIVIPTRDEIDKPKQWLDLIQDYEPTIWSSTPPLLQALVDEASPDRGSALTSLRLILVTTSALPPDLARAAKHLVPQARLGALAPTLEARAEVRRDVLARRRLS
jgi:pyochelin synthetase